MKTTKLLPEECRQEIEDKLESVKSHWKDKGLILTQSFSGWIAAINWVLGLENADQPQDRRSCQRQHACGPMDMCLVCGAKHPLWSPQTTLAQIPIEPEPEAETEEDSEEAD